jgi:hypothetical protein
MLQISALICVFNLIARYSLVYRFPSLFAVDMFRHFRPRIFSAKKAIEKDFKIVFLNHFCLKE